MKTGRNTLHIRDLEIRYRTALAPMASLTNVVLRKFFDEIGNVGFMVTEMVSAEAIRRANKRTLSMLGSSDFRSPQFVQMFGHDPLAFSEAIHYIQNETAFSGIDINMGCPVRKITRAGAGAALLREPLLASRIIKEIRRKTRLPLTVKIRLLDSPKANCEFIDRLQGEGVDAITVHFRFVSDRSNEKARWEYAPLLREKIHTVFIGNGDIKSPQDAREKLDSVDVIMVGRGALFNPAIFSDLGDDRLRKRETQDHVRSVDFIRRLVELIEFYVAPDLRLKQLKAYTRFLVSSQSDSKKMRKAIYETTDFDQAKKLLSRFFRFEKSEIQDES